MMKRNILIFLLIACMIIMAACGSKGTVAPTPTADETATSTPYGQFYTAAHRIGFIIVTSSEFEMYAAE
jgi:predicted small lipoprotein YifL